MTNRARNHVPHVAVALVVAAMALTANMALDTSALRLAALCPTMNGILVFQATFRAIPSTFLTGCTAANGLALIVSTGNFDSSAGPSTIGAIKQFSRGFTVPLLAVLAVLLVGALSIAWLGGPGANADEAVAR